MTLDELFMPPIRIDGTRVRRVERLGAWVEPPVPSEERRAAMIARQARYRAANRQQRIDYNRKRREARKAA